MTAFVYAEIEVTDHEVYKREYVPKALTAVAVHAGRFVSTGRSVSRRVGCPADVRVVMIEFDSFELANAFYDSAAYREASVVRDRCAVTHRYSIVGFD